MELIVLRVKPTSNQFPTNILYVMVDSILLFSKPIVRCPWGEMTPKDYGYFTKVVTRRHIQHVHKPRNIILTPETAEPHGV